MALTERLALIVEAHADQAVHELKGLADTSDKTGEAFDNTGAASKKLSGLMKTGLVAGAALAGAALVKLAGDASKAASDAQQSIGATENIFGKFADTVIDRSKEAADTYGLSANQYRENANLIASLFKNQGVAVDELADKTDQMIALASDLAATFGGTTSDAVEALSSAFKGEFNPLERYGVSLKQSAVNAELAATGQNKLTGAALTAAQQQATVALIMKQTASAQGQFAAQTGTLAEQQQIAAAKVENLKAALGEGLLPVQTSLLQVLNELLPAVEGVAKAIAFLGSNDVARKTTLAIGATVTAMLLLNKGVKAYKAVAGSELVGIIRRQTAAHAANAAAIEAEGVASAATAGKVAGFGSKLGGLAAKAGIWGAAIAAGIGVGAAAWKAFKDDDVFGDLSSKLQKQVAEKTASSVADLGVDEAKKKLEELQAQFRQMMEHPADSSQYQFELAQVKGQIDGLTVGIDNAKTSTEHYSGVVDGMTEQQKEAADAMQKAADAAKAQQDAIDKLRDAIIEAAGGGIAYQKSQLAVQDAQDKVLDATDKLREAQKKHGKNSREAKEAARDLAKANLDLNASYLDQAKNAADVAQEQAEANGSIFTAADRTQRYRDELAKMAAQLNPKSQLRKNLQGLIDDLDAAGRTRRANLILTVKAQGFKGDVDKLVSQGFITGARAAGGPTLPNRDYVVGENGPEIWRSSVGGAITPNAAIRGGDGAMTVRLSAEDRALLQQVAGRPVSVKVDSREIARASQTGSLALARL